MQPSVRNFNQRPTNALVASGRVGPRVEYVNRAGQPVDPKTGKVLQPSVSKAGSGKPYDRFVPSKENGPVRRWLPLKQSGIIFGGLTIIPTDEKLDPPPRSCFNCWKPGHSKRECTKPVVNHHCHNCGRKGEDVDTCPRCSRAYQIYLAKIRAKERGEVLDSAAVADMFQGSDEESAIDMLRDEEERSKRVFNKLQSLQQERHVDHSSFQDDGGKAYLNHYFTGKHDGTPLHQDRGDTPLFQDRDQTEPSSCLDVGYRSRDLYRDNDMNVQYRDVDRDRFRDCEYKHTCDKSVLRNYEGNYGSGGQFEGYSRQGYTSSSSSSLGDPVQEILNLAKTISHLSPDTQDLIMRQVIAERKERTRQKLLQEQEVDTWP